MASISECHAGIPMLPFNSHSAIHDGRRQVSSPGSCEPWRFQARDRFDEPWRRSLAHTPLRYGLNLDFHVLLLKDTLVPPSVLDRCATINKKMTIRIICSLGQPFSIESHSSFFRLRVLSERNLGLGLCSIQNFLHDSRTKKSPYTGSYYHQKNIPRWDDFIFASFLGSGVVCFEVCANTLEHGQLLCAYSR